MSVADYFMNNIKYPSIADEIVSMLVMSPTVSNTSRMVWIVDSIGWPTISKVGQGASRAAALVVGRATYAQVFQWHCLLHMKIEAPGEVEPRDIAYLDDIVSLEQFQIQMYGTQYVVDDGQCILRPIFEPKQVNSRRASLGLEPLDVSWIEDSVRHWAKRRRRGKGKKTLQR